MYNRSCQQHQSVASAVSSFRQLLWLAMFPPAFANARAHLETAAGTLPVSGLLRPGVGWPIMSPVRTFPPGPLAGSQTHAQTAASEVVEESTSEAFQALFPETVDTSVEPIAAFLSAQHVRTPQLIWSVLRVRVVSP